MVETSGSNLVQFRLQFLRLFVGELLNSRAVVVLLLLLRRLGLRQLGRSLGLLFPVLFGLHLLLFVGLLRELVVARKRIFDELTRRERRLSDSVCGLDSGSCRQGDGAHLLRSARFAASEEICFSAKEAEKCVDQLSKEKQFCGI